MTNLYDLTDDIIYIDWDWTIPITTHDKSVGIFCKKCGKRVLFDSKEDGVNEEREIDFIEDHLHGIDYKQLHNHIGTFYPKKKIGKDVLNGKNE